MAGESFTAGSIWIQFKTGLQELTKGFAKAVTGVDTFDKAAARSFSKIAKASSRLLSVQFAVAQLTGVLGDEDSGLGKSIKIISKGVTTFTSILAIMPTPTGLAIGAVAGLATAFSSLLKPTEEETAKLEALQKATKTAADSYRNLEAELAAISRETASRKSIGAIIGEDLKKIDVEDAIAKVKAVQKVLSDAEEELRLFSKAYQEALKKENEARKAAEARSKQTTTGRSFGLATQAFVGLPEGTAEAAEAAEKVAKVNADVAKKAGEVEEKMKVLRAAQAEAQVKASAELVRQYDLQLRVRDAVEAVANPIKRVLVTVGLTADEAARLAKAYRDAEKSAGVLNDIATANYVMQVEADAKKREDAEKWGRTLDQIAADNYVAQVETDEKKRADLEAWGRMQQEIAEENYVLQVERDEELRKKREEKMKETAKKFQDSFADPFAASIADGLRDGILSGASALETLKAMGENMFRESITSLSNFLQEGLSNAITSVVGSGGEALGGLLNAAMGVAGYFLSGRGRGKGSTVYGAVNGITNTEATRGIVAGPSSVAIARVGDDLSRSMAPVVERLDALVRIGTSISAKMGAGGSMLAGTVPTA